MLICLYFGQNTVPLYGKFELTALVIKNRFR